MPTYEYECTKCSNHFEVFQAMTDEPVKKCPQCGKAVRRLILGGAGVIFKGSGFYVTDKAAKTAETKTGTKTGKSSSEATSSSEAKPTGSDAVKDTAERATAPSASSGNDSGGKNGKNPPAKAPKEKQ